MSHEGAEKDYVLGTHDAEIERLGLQHRIWRPFAAEAWRRAGFGPGQRLVDLGCGPGYATLDLAELVGPRGTVLGLDRSRRFLDVLEQKARERALAHIEAREIDFDEQELPARDFDGIWTRWVYCFVRNPRRLLERAAAALQPGGVMVIHEYCDYRGWRLSPRSTVFEAFVNEVILSWRQRGGEPDIGLELPGWLGQLGFSIRSLLPLVHAARPGDAIWPWPKAFIDVGIQRLVDLGDITEARGEEFTEAFARMESATNGFQLTPMVLEIVAVKA